MEPFCLLPWGLPSSPWPFPAQLLESPGASLPDLDLPVPWGHSSVPPWAPSPCSFPEGPFRAPSAQHFQSCRCRCLLHSQQPELCWVLSVLSGGPGGGRQLLGALCHEPGACQHFEAALLSRSWASLLLVAGPGGKGREGSASGRCSAVRHPTPLLALTHVHGLCFRLLLGGTCGRRSADEPSGARQCEPVHCTRSPLPCCRAPATGALGTLVVLFCPGSGACPLSESAWLSCCLCCGFLHANWR